ncbi:FecR domain-containing protein [Sphingobium sp. AN641]|uniref:FecR family protein n=1 Tax=Sphingobium sp. AN641 TaxID=3133443 RepID=UPI0030C07276
MSDIANILPPGDDAGAPQDQAVRWLAYLYSGEATNEGRANFSSWLDHSSINVVAYRNLEQIWRDMIFAGVQTIASTEASDDKPASNIVALESRSSSLSPLSGRRGAIAAMMAVAASLVLALGIWRLEFFDTPTVHAYRTAVGEIRTVSLSDGTRVTLAAESAIRAIFSNRRRGVELVAGRAWFDVASNPAKPFTVLAAATHIQVVGTQFDVDRAPDDVRVSVARGVVRVAPLAGPATRNDGVRLVAGQRVLSALDGRIGPIERFDPARAAPWRTGLLIYRNARLKDVVAEVNRYRVDKIVLADGSLGDMRITMAVRADQTETLLLGLEATAPLQIDRTPSRIMVRPKR